MTDYVKPALLMAAIGGLKWIDTEDPNNILIARCVYIASVAFAWSILGLIYWRINQTNDQTPLTVDEKDIDPSAQSPLAGLLGNS